MKRTVVMLSLTLAGGIILGAVGSRMLHAQQEPIKRTVLVKTDLEGIEGKEAILFLAELAPGAVGGKHYHPGTEVFYAVEGAFTHEPEGKPPVTLKAGDVFFIPAGVVHSAKNVGTDNGAELATYLVEKGKPLVEVVE